MNFDSPLPAPDSQDVLLLQQVQQNWNQGSQDVALNLIRPRADEGQAWAASLLSWLLMQQGYPALEESITWAITAAHRGHPAQLATTFNNVISNLSSYPQLSSRLPELAELGLPWSSGVDAVGQGWNIAQSGQPELGLQIMMLQMKLPYTLTDTHLAALVADAQDRTNELNRILASIREQQRSVEVASAEGRAAMNKATLELETSAKQAGLLITTATSDATNALFLEDAERNAKESRGAWLSGLVVLGGAATVAVLPVILHYLRVGADYSSIEQIALHLVSTAALATFAGVLLARARSRDQAAQRANDLSTAMGTMIAYSSQIRDPEEKQRFMSMMGQMVLQAHLSSGSKQGGGEDSVMGMVALANLIKPASAPAPVSPS
ncbi:MULTISPECIES: hypothetical protein [unclassified Pseudoclavibacter]|uniref:hypothetical protein n=1 Tax=unclassified Pseudoclavibacter TaxID=2615177 RepID=UPI001BAC50E8|nr:hypothetical protein [Pseudoclavibacter sp. Marseille-Q4354]MBS3178200.1 hypothetical protein [Pseudoclavibacter sp. Marseille-Q4354]